jgi:hypothetical protein
VEGPSRSDYWAVETASVSPEDVYVSRTYELLSLCQFINKVIQNSGPHFCVIQRVRPDGSSDLKNCSVYPLFQLRGAH